MAVQSGLVPDIKPYATGEPKWEHKQSRYPHLAHMLPTRAIALGASGSGKSVLYQSCILDIWRGCWKQIHVFSPSAKLDPSWIPVKQYVKDELGQNPEEAFHETFDPKVVEKILATQKRVIEAQKADDRKREGNQLWAVAIFFDDFARGCKFPGCTKTVHRGSSFFRVNLHCDAAFQAS